jgi:kynurenine formamidase
MKTTLAEAIGGYEVVDLSHTLEEGMPRPQVPYGHVPWKSEAQGDCFNTFMILVFEHAGTHVDAPIHLAGTHGATIDEVPPDRWMGPICCLDMTHKRERGFVTRADIQAWEKRLGGIEAGDVVLLNLGWECNWRVPSGVEKQPYLKNNPGLHPDAALYLVERGPSSSAETYRQSTQTPSPTNPPTRSSSRGASSYSKTPRTWTGSPQGAPTS